MNHIDDNWPQRTFAPMCQCYLPMFYDTTKIIDYVSEASHLASGEKAKDTTGQTSQPLPTSLETHVMFSLYERLSDLQGHPLDSVQVRDRSLRCHNSICIFLHVIFRHTSVPGHHFKTMGCLIINSSPSDIKASWSFFCEHFCMHHLGWKWKESLRLKLITCTAVNLHPHDKSSAPALVVCLKKQKSWMNRGTRLILIFCCLIKNVYQPIKLLLRLLNSVTSLI